MGWELGQGSPGRLWPRVLRESARGRGTGCRCSRLASWGWPWERLPKPERGSQGPLCPCGRLQGTGTPGRKVSHTGRSVCGGGGGAGVTSSGNAACPRTQHANLTPGVYTSLKQEKWLGEVTLPGRGGTDTGTEATWLQSPIPSILLESSPRGRRERSLSRPALGLALARRSRRQGSVTSASLFYRQ